MINGVNKIKKALIYCRVSSDRQVKEGNGLGSQEKRCRDYAKTKSYLVVRSFPDEGISGGLFDRPAMKNLIAYLDVHPTEKFIVVFDDLKRFSRDVDVHFKLKSEIIGRGSDVECPNFRFEDSPEGKFVETVLVATGELEKNQNKRQVIQKMTARLQDGFWCFCTPPALKNMDHPTYKRVLNGRIEPISSIFKRAIEKYSSDELNTLDEVRNFINTQYELYSLTKRISLNGVTNMLKNPLYAGWIKYEKWGVPIQKAKHEGFISKETFDIVQTKLQGKAKPRLRKDYNLDFSLRNHVLCSECHKPLTASWSKGKLQRHPYYWCKNTKCTMVWKTIRKKDIDERFESLLQNAKLPKEVLDLTRAIFMDVWNERKTQGDKLYSVFTNEIDDIDSEISNLSQRIGKTANEIVATELEKQIEKLAIKRKELESKQTNGPKYNDEKLGTAYDAVAKALEEPLLLWKSDNFEERRTILFMYFQEKLIYNHDTGFGTPQMSPAVSLIHSMAGSKNHLVEMPGVEPGSVKAFYKLFARDSILFDSSIDEQKVQRLPIQPILKCLIRKRSRTFLDLTRLCFFPISSSRKLRGQHSRPNLSREGKVHVLSRLTRLGFVCIKDKCFE